MNGTPHTCFVQDEDAARLKLQKWLGEWTLEPTE
jgi:hypothetical protein